MVFAHLRRWPSCRRERHPCLGLALRLESAQATQENQTISNVGNGPRLVPPILPGQSRLTAAPLLGLAKTETFADFPFSFYYFPGGVHPGRTTQMNCGP